MRTRSLAASAQAIHGPLATVAAVCASRPRKSHKRTEEPFELFLVTDSEADKQTLQEEFEKLEVGPRSNQRLAVYSEADLGARKVGSIWAVSERHLLPSGPSLLAKSD